LTEHDSSLISGVDGVNLQKERKEVITKVFLFFKISKECGKLGSQRIKDDKQ